MPFDCYIQIVAPFAILPLIPQKDNTMPAVAASFFAELCQRRNGGGSSRSSLCWRQFIPMNRGFSFVG